MDSFDDIKQIWLSADTNKLPGADEAVKTIKRYRRIFILKSIALALFVLVLTGLMVHVLIFYKSHFISTRIGEVLILIALLILWGVSIKSLRKIPIRTNYTNEEYIEFLKDQQCIKAEFQKRTQGIGYLISSAGLLIYLYEGVYENKTLLIISYSLTIAWVLVCWFVLRPIVARRVMKKLDDRIKNLERLSDQLKNNN